MVFGALRGPSSSERFPCLRCFRASNCGQPAFMAQAQSPDEDPVARVIGLASFRERAVRNYERMLRAKSSAPHRASERRCFPPSRGLLIEQGVMPFREDTQCPLHLDRPYVD
jgi:hypothetical protein